MTDKAKYIQIDKLAIETDNPSVSGGATISEAKEALKDRVGTIFIMVELFAMPEIFIEGFSGIINDLKTEYYLPPLENEGGVEKRFEESLGRANRRLKKLIGTLPHQLELKNINAIIGLIHLNQIHFSQIGHNNAFLFHQNKKYDTQIIDIFSQTNEKKQKITPEKLFSNIISGQITPRDSLIICNDAVLQYLSQSEMSRIATSYEIGEVLREFDEMLNSENESENLYIIAIKPTQLEEEAVKTAGEEKIIPTKSSTNRVSIPPQQSINNLITTQSSTEKYLTPSLMPNWKKFIILLWRGGDRLLKIKIKYNNIIWRHSIISLKELTPLINQSKKLITRKQNKSTSATTTETIDQANQVAFTTQEDATRIEATKKTDPGIISPDTNKEEPEKINIPTEKNNTDTSNKRANDFIYESKPKIKLSQKLSQAINRYIGKFYELNKFQQILLVCGFIFIFLFSQSIVWQGIKTNQTNNVNMEEITSEIEEAINTAEARNIFNDEAGARVALAQAETLLTQIPEHKKYEAIKNNWQAKIEALSQTLLKVSYIENPEVIADLTNQNSEANTIGLQKLGDIIFVFDNHNNNLYKIDQANKQTLALNLGENLNNVTKIKTLNNDNLIFQQAENKFYQFNIPNETLTEVLAVDVISPDFDIYGSRLYTLQPDNNQLYRHQMAGGVFNRGSAWIQEDDDIKNAVAMAIDGGIYVMKEGGDITYYLNGIKQNNNFQQIATNIDQPTQIITEVNGDYIYILDPQNQKIVVSDKNGNLKIQYISKKFFNMTTMAIDERQQKIYLLADNKIFEINLSI